jgi:hypothetical protein
VDYATNPPASGDHWGIWAEYRTFTEPVPRPMLVHDLEHGAIVMAYACDGTCATDAVAAFEDAAAAFGVDPTCAILPSNPPSRIVITPDPLLALPIGLSAWRATYTASCIDPPSLLAFIEDHYAKAPEDLCAQGKDPADPATGVPDCP